MFGVRIIFDLIEFTLPVIVLHFVNKLRGDYYFISMMIEEGVLSYDISEEAMT